MAQATIRDLTVDEFKQLIREVVVQTFSEMFGDPDAGMELDDTFKVELQRTLAVETPDKTISAGDVATKLGLAW